MFKGVCFGISAAALLGFSAQGSELHPAKMDIDISAVQELPKERGFQTRGVLRSGQSADIAAGMAGRLLQANYKPGQKFSSGAMLAKFDCTRQKAQLSALTQAHETLKARYTNQAELFELGAAGALDVTIARSEMQQAAAERAALSAGLKDCQVYAPYAGFVTHRHVSAYETPQAGQPLYTIERSGTLEISIIAPSKWMRWMKVGKSFDFSVDETGEIFKAKIIRLGAAVDPVSQTIELTAKPTGRTKALSGMSGLADFGPNP